MSDSIRLQVANILAEAGIVFKVTLVGPTVWDNWECDQWAVTFSVSRAGMPKAAAETFDYRTGTGLRVDTPESRMAKVCLKNVSRNSIAWLDACKRMKPKTPDAADVLSSLVLDASACNESFADWCGNYGFDSDSRKAFKIYEACQENGYKLRKIFSKQTLDKLAEILQEY